jgi:5-methylcytosine-specific restriction endonuclease McrA
VIGTYTPIPVEMRRRYEAYINSAEWRRRRRRAIERAGYHCEKCGVSAQEERLEVHHLTYERIGHERDEDLSVLCHACHAKADLERANKGQQKARSALWAKRLERDAGDHSGSLRAMSTAPTRAVKRMRAMSSNG